jgi:Fic family protein
MDVDKFRGSPSGSLVPTIGGALAFVPNALPPQQSLASVSTLLTRAAFELGELKGIGTTLPNPYLLISPLQRKEAVISSRIEGTATELDDLLLFEISRDQRRGPADAREVWNYVAALKHALDRLNELPISTRLMNETHGILMRNVRPDRSTRYPAGEVRQEQNWIGAQGSGIGTARFVPPPSGDVLHKTLSDLERYINESSPDGHHDLIRAALIHYQFEAIHPYPDGNGRLGRLLIPVYLAQRGLLPIPLLYLSPYFERNRSRYMDLLLAVSREGAWEEWVGFFLTGVFEQSRDAIIRVRKLQALRSKYLESVRQARRSALLAKLIDAILERPYMTVPQAATILDVTYRAAQNNIDRLVSAGILNDLEIGFRPRVFVAPEVFAIIEADLHADENTTAP